YYTRCQGDGCLLCRLGKARKHFDLIPVYDPVGRAVAVLPVPANQRPGALAPLLMPHLRALRGGARVVLEVRHHGHGVYAVAALPLPADADDGAAAVARFQAEVEAGRVDLRDAYASLANAELAA